MKQTKQLDIIVINLNARLHPTHRNEIFEIPFDDFIKNEHIGEICGGGTLLEKNGEIIHCDIEIELNRKSNKDIDAIITKLEELWAPIGSKIIIEKEEIEIPFWKNEGLALYLNWTDLSKKNSEWDFNYLYEEINISINEVGKIFSLWQWQTETAIYMYWKSFKDINKKISSIIKNHPLCQKCRIEKIA